MAYQCQKVISYIWKPLILSRKCEELFLVERPFETVFQYISNRLLERVEDKSDRIG